MAGRVVLGVLIAVVVCGWGIDARALECRAESEFLHSYPANANNSLFKFKFRVSSDDCKDESCRGHVQYTIHYQTEQGKSWTKSKRVGYSIARGQRATEVTDETYPHETYIVKNLIIRDVEISEVSCN